jgi:hypothetical protein
MSGKHLRAGSLQNVQEIKRVVFDGLNIRIVVRGPGDSEVGPNSLCYQVHDFWEVSEVT